MPINIVRAWKDRDYRNSLNEEQLAMLPENPAGSVDLADLTEDELAYMQGAGGSQDDIPTVTPLCPQSDLCSDGCPRSYFVDDCKPNEIAVNAAGFGAGVVGGAVLWDAVTAGTWTVVTVTV